MFGAAAAYAVLCWLFVNKCVGGEGLEGERRLSRMVDDGIE